MSAERSFAIIISYQLELLYSLPKIKLTDLRNFFIIAKMRGYCLFVVSNLIAGTSPQKSIRCQKSGRENVPFRMAIENGELMHECFPMYSMGTAILLLLEIARMK